MRRWLLDVWERFRQTAILVTHDVEEAIFLSDRIYVFSARPGRVLREVPVNLARPRPEGLLDTPAFVALRDELLAALGVQS